ncbi:MAG TPA: hypothetical protein VFC19_44840 [Candidatus Limnocylindrales bacterium]|nr:hypothetical protein [Candidatus Limnocylindrales bacterium]
MRGLWLACLGGLALGAAVLVGLNLPGGPFTSTIFWLPIVCSLALLTAALYAVNDHRWEDLPPQRVADTLREAPRSVLIGLGLLFVIAVGLRFMFGLATLLDYQQLFAGIGLWLGGRRLP